MGVVGVGVLLLAQGRKEPTRWVRPLPPPPPLLVLVLVVLPGGGGGSGVRVLGEKGGGALETSKDQRPDANTPPD